MKSIWIYDPIHGQNFYLCLGWKPSRLQRWIKRNFDLDLEAPNTNGKTLLLPSGHIIVWLDKYNPSLLAHELVHAAFFALGPRGYKTSHEDHEELAYLVGWLTKETYAQLASRRKTKA